MTGAPAPAPASAPLGRSALDWARAVQAIFIIVAVVAPEWADLQDEVTALLATGLGLATAVIELVKRRSVTPVADPRIVRRLADGRVV